MAKERKSLREELLEARDNLQRELDILATGPMKLAWQPGTVEQLEATLAEINQQLAELGPNDD